MVDCVKEMTVKKFCKHGEYGSFGHLLFLLVILFVGIESFKVNGPYTGFASCLILKLFCTYVSVHIRISTVEE